MQEYGITPIVADPWVHTSEAQREYNITLTKWEDINQVDCIIIAVAHQQFKDLKLNQLIPLFNKATAAQQHVLIDVKGIYPTADLKKQQLNFWRL